MTKPIIISCLVVIVFGAIFLSSSSVFAQEDKLTLTITPPLFKLNMEPGDNINASVKIVNNNSEPINVYASAMDFKGKPEGGVDFLMNKPASADVETGKHKLSSWIKLEGIPIEIAPQQSRDIPFTIMVPQDAEPGGHYGAIAVGTKPPEGSESQGSVVKISSLLTSLILVKIKGEIKENGWIDGFSPEKKLYREPDVNFNLSFRNSGNVHLQPKGEIIIYNPYNKELGRIKVNDAVDFGNVLPDSGRKWTVRWKSEKNFWDTGRHRAMLYLSYGEEQPQMASQIAYFWVADLKLLGIIAGSAAALMLLLFMSIKIYVRRAVLRTQKELGLMAANLPSAASAVTSAQTVGSDGASGPDAVAKSGRLMPKDKVRGAIDLRGKMR